MVAPFESRVVKTGKPFRSPTRFKEAGSSACGRPVLYQRSFWNSTKMPFDVSALRGLALGEGLTRAAEAVEAADALPVSRDRASKSDA